MLSRLDGTLGIAVPGDGQDHGHIDAGGRTHTHSPVDDAGPVHPLPVPSSPCEWRGCFPFICPDVCTIRYVSPTRMETGSAEGYASGTGYSALSSDWISLIVTITVRAV